MNEADNYTNYVESELDVEEMIQALTDHCVAHDIPLSVRIGAETECNHETLWLRENLERILADINERICVIAGYEEETMDRRLHMLFVELAKMLMPRT